LPLFCLCLVFAFLSPQKHSAGRARVHACHKTAPKALPLCRRLTSNEAWGLPPGRRN
jgi:hypothetical protein